MNRFRTIHPVRRSAVLLAALASTLLTAFTAAPAAFARAVPPPAGAGGGTVQTPPPQVHVVVAGGMPGWQIALIAVGAALAAAVIAVMLDRSRAARRHLTRAAA
ncbi:MAG TPA: hypothetical protein VGR98_06315 [Streptosporangiaceae bacterium]|nr:hypothetical protein [Streptosporangiaceae bacterium]